MSAPAVPPGPLVWNSRDDDRGEAQRRQQLEQRQRQEAEQRAIHQRNLPIWRQYLAAIGPAIEAAREEVGRREAERERAWAAYLRAYHAQSGGSTPRQGTGPLVLLRAMPGMHPEDLARVPARRECEAHDEAEQAVLAAQRHLHSLEADKRALEHNIALCQQAGAR